MNTNQNIHNYPFYPTLQKSARYFGHKYIKHTPLWAGILPSKLMAYEPTPPENTCGYRWSIEESPTTYGTL
jgi:hypothetical protein